MKKLMVLHGGPCDGHEVEVDLECPTVSLPLVSKFCRLLWDEEARMAYPDPRGMHETSDGRMIMKFIAAVYSIPDGNYLPEMSEKEVGP